MIELVSDRFSERSSHLPLRIWRQAIDSVSSPLEPLPHYPWPGGMREALQSGHRALGATVGAVWRRVGLLLTTHSPVSTKLISPSPPARAPAADLEKMRFCALVLADNVDVFGAVLGFCLMLLRPS